MIFKYILLFFILFKNSDCLNNGVALTPPMGWLSWGTFGCATNCKANGLSHCISEILFMEMADKLAYGGYLEAGYEYINIDDCWMSRFRNEFGILHADHNRFPHDIKYLADYMHARGLKLGIYQSAGNRTCQGYPGSAYHMEIDANIFSEWGVDMVKLDACYSEAFDLDKGYIQFGAYLNDSYRSILYSCSWPFYKLVYKEGVDFELISKHCNIWRTYIDIGPSLESIRKIITFFGDYQEGLTRYVGPGHWSDPDMLMIGHSDSLTPGQSRIQMSVWSILPGPLLIAADLRIIGPEYKKILLNKRAISVNQDRLGLPGKRIIKNKDLEVWMRRISPKYGDHSFAIAFINWKKQTQVVFDFNFSQLHLNNENEYEVVNVFTGNILGFINGNGTVPISIPPMDVIMLHCIIQPKPTVSTEFHAYPVLAKPTDSTLFQ